MTEPLRLSLELDCPPAHAFAVWTTQLSRWWPADHTVSGEPGLHIEMEGRVGGRIFERTVAGAEFDWGEVTIWDPPARLGYHWHLRRDAADTTDVEITFSARGTSATHVEIIHRGWERLGALGPGAREANRAGWAGLLQHFTAACTAAPATEGARCR